MTADHQALGNVEQVKALAEALSHCADEIHRRVMRDIQAHPGALLSDAERAAARALLDDEQLLRQRANGLYADAARYVVESLNQPQRHVVELTQAALEKIRTIGALADVLALVASLAGLGAAAASGQAAPIVLALEKVRAQLRALKQADPGPAD